MSTPILDAPTDTTGWLLEMTGNGDNTVYSVVRHEPKPPFDQQRLIAVAGYALDHWFVAMTDEPDLTPLLFKEHDDAIAWLSYLANLNTQNAAA